MTETPENSDGETVAQKLKQSLKYQGVLHKGQIDATEANRRAIISVTKRRFVDEDVDQDAWNKNISSIIEEIQRKVYEDPVKAVKEQHERKTKNKELDAGTYSPVNNQSSSRVIVIDAPSSPKIVTDDSQPESPSIATPGKLNKKKKKKGLKKSKTVIDSASKAVNMLGSALDADEEMKKDEPQQTGRLNANEIQLVSGADRAFQSQSVGN